jgi:glycine oxidase
MAMADVTVVGGGVFGLAVAWACARRGAAVRLMDRRRIGAGASGGLTGALAPHVPEGWNTIKAFQFDSLVMSGDWWRAVAKAAGSDPGYRGTGRIQPLADAAAVERARERSAGAAAHWEDAAQWAVVPAETVPGLKLDCPTGLVIHDTLSARLHPRRACAALAGAVRALGGEVLEGLAVTTTDPADKGARATIWATGWEGLTAMDGADGQPAGGGIKGQALLLDHDARGAPVVFAPGLFLVAHDDGTLAVGSTSERSFDAPDTTDQKLDALLARACAVCPEIAGATVLQRWAGVRPRARSGAPMLGALPGRPGEFIANGGFGIGFGIAPKVAETMADLVLDGHDAIPAEFRPETCL